MGFQLEDLNVRSRKAALIFLNKKMIKHEIFDIGVEIVAKELLNQSTKQGLTRGRVLSDFIDHCILIAVSVAEFPIPPAVLRDSRTKKFNYPLLQRIRSEVLPVLGYKIQKFPFKKYALTVASTVPLTPETRKTFFDGLDLMMAVYAKKKKAFTVSMVLVCLYVASMIEDNDRNRLSQENISKILPVSVATLRKYWRNFYRIIHTKLKEGN